MMNWENEISRPTLYTNIKWSGYRITELYLVSTRPEGYGRMAANFCGKTVADRTWIVILYFPVQAPEGARRATLPEPVSSRLEGLVPIPLTQRT